jgi:CRISPR-associated protein Cst1
MSCNKVKLTLGDWRWNASIVGFINIIGEENIDYVNQEDTVEFSNDVLENFEEKYFKYLINTYEKTLSWYKIVAYRKTIEYFEDEGYSEFDLKSLEKLNKYIKNIAKNYLKSASYKSTYELLHSDVNILEKEKQLTAIKEPKNEEEFKIKRDIIISEVKERFEIIKDIISYCSSYNAKKYLAGKNVIYNVIKNSWNGVSFLNAQTKEKDIYIDYKNYFVEPAKHYIGEDKKKFKYNCFTCDQPIRDFKNDLSFLNATGFDVARKSSHVWNFTNDIAICPICKLIYSCLPAGITYVYDRGIYINTNFSVEKALEINNKLKLDILKSGENSGINIYRALVNSLNEESNENLKYELADIQIVRYENETYRFNILSKNTLEIINKSKKELDHLINASYKEIKTFFNIYELVIKRLFNNQNLYTLIHKTILYKLSDARNCYFNMSHIKKLLYINIKILGGMGYMVNAEKDIDIVKEGNLSGYHLRENYKSKDADNKLSGISYRLLNALKTDNKDMFMDVVLNCYLYVKKQVPKIIVEALKDDDVFKTVGYAFVAGLIDEKTNKTDEK